MSTSSLNRSFNRIQSRPFSSIYKISPAPTQGIYGPLRIHIFYIVGYGVGRWQDVLCNMDGNVRYEKQGPVNQPVLHHARTSSVFCAPNSRDGSGKPNFTYKDKKKIREAHSYLLLSWFSSLW